MTYREFRHMPLRLRWGLGGILLKDALSPGRLQTLQIEQSNNLATTAPTPQIYILDSIYRMKIKFSPSCNQTVHLASEVGTSTQTLFQALAYSRAMLWPDSRTHSGRSAFTPTGLEHSVCSPPTTTTTSRAQGAQAQFCHFLLCLPQWVYNGRESAENNIFD